MIPVANPGKRERESPREAVNRGVYVRQPGFIKIGKVYPPMGIH